MLTAYAEDFGGEALHKSSSITNAKPNAMQASSATGFTQTNKESNSKRFTQTFRTGEFVVDGETPTVRDSSRKQTLSRKSTVRREFSATEPNLIPSDSKPTL
jgi:hypothetical protein